MRRLGIICILFFSSMSALAATEISLWHSYRGLEKDALETVIQKFNESQAEITVVSLQVPHDAYPDKITAAIPRGKGPDIFIFAQDRIGDWAVQDVIQPIGFWVNEDIKSRFLPGTVDALVYEDELYGLPTAFKCTALFYNKKLIQSPPETTDQMIALGKANTDLPKKQFGLVYENGLTYYNSLWIYGFGGGFFDAKRNPVINQQANIDAMIFTKSLLKTHHIMPDEISNSLVTSLFNDNKAAMVISGPWFRAEIAASIDYGIAPLPLISSLNKPARPFLTVEAFMMSSKTEHPLEAFQVIDSLTNNEYPLIMASHGKQTVALKSAYSGKVLEIDPLMDVFKQQLPNTAAMPNFPEMRMIWTPMDIAISKIITKEADPSAALTEAQEKVLKDIELFRK